MHLTGLPSELQDTLLTFLGWSAVKGLGETSKRFLVYVRGHAIFREYWIRNLTRTAHANFCHLPEENRERVRMKIRWFCRGWCVHEVSSFALSVEKDRFHPIISERVTNMWKSISRDYS